MLALNLVSLRNRQLAILKKQLEGRVAKVVDRAVEWDKHLWENWHWGPTGFVSVCVGVGYAAKSLDRFHILPIVGDFLESLQSAAKKIDFIHITDRVEITLPIGQVLIITKSPLQINGIPVIVDQWTAWTYSFKFYNPDPHWFNIDNEGIRFVSDAVYHFSIDTQPLLSWLACALSDQQQ